MLLKVTSANQNGKKNKEKIKKEEKIENVLKIFR